jgi:hypothetical protein
MARKPTARIDHAFYDVIYQDGTQTSRRKVLASVAASLDGEDAVRAAIEEQDREIAERSGRPRGPIKSIAKSEGR